MHVAVINYSFAPRLDAGALLDRFETLTGWCRALVDAGARVTALQRWLGDRDLERDGVRYLFRAGDHPAPTPPWWTRPSALHAAAAALDPDVVHLNGIVHPAQTWLLRRALPARTALVVQDHGTVPPPPRPPWRSPSALLGRAVRRLGLGQADAFLFTARAQAEPWRAAGLIRPDQPVFEVLEASRAPVRVGRAEARAAGILRGNPALLWVGHLDANKDPLTVLRGFERALPALPGAHLTFVFRGATLRGELERWIAATPALAGRVHLAGEVAPADMPRYLAAADVFVLGSHREGSGYALIEALACGVVPVVSDIPSFRVITRGGALGALFPPGDADAAAAALVDVGRNEPGRLRPAIASHYQAELSWPAVGRRALAVYRQVLAQRQAAAGVPAAPVAVSAEEERR